MSFANLATMEDYLAACQAEAQEKYALYGSMEDLAQAMEDINAYANLDLLGPPKNVLYIEDLFKEEFIAKTKEAILKGQIFWEHTAAGEATRLKLGPKYLIMPHEKINLMELLDILNENKKNPLSYEDLRTFVPCEPRELLPLSLGSRHISQLVFELEKLAKAEGLDPMDVIGCQKNLLIVSESIIENIEKRFLARNFLGLKPENCLFMVQPALPGLALDNKKFHYNEKAPKHLHNHGQMAMQMTWDNEIFHLDRSGQRHYLEASEFEAILESCLDKISYNIEDLNYLTGALDMETIAVALHLKEKGYEMTMEIVANDPKNPIKGGLCAYDAFIERDIVIESFHLRGWTNDMISHLNKNFNHFPNPVGAWRALKEKGLNMPPVVKDDHLYFQPVQGDLNLLLKTAYLSRKIPKSIYSWKAPTDTAKAITAMFAQDNQPGFKDFYEKHFKQS